MAKAPAIFAKPKEQNAGNEKLAKEMQKRVARAELDFNRHRRRIADCYKYAMPWRHKLLQNQPGDDLDDIFDENAMTIVEDFAADMNQTFTPQKNDWIEFQPVGNLDASQRNQIKQALQDYQGTIFEEMGRSNLYQALQESYLDLSPGTMSLMIHDIDISEPIHCQAIPAGTELLLDRGPYGYVDGRWRRWNVREEEINVLWPAARKENGRKFSSSGTNEHQCIDGIWRLWNDRSAEAYQYAVMSDGMIIYEEIYKGPGSCPIIVARWSRDPTTAWGVGPLYRTTPAVKTLNQIKYLMLKKLDFSVDPAVSYESDGTMLIEESSISPGKWIPRDPQSKAPEVIESQAKFDVAWLQADDLISSIRRAHYQDHPDQQGKTPPSATQWVDEAAMRARRMGTPATNLVHELQIPTVKRFAYLLNKRGKLPKVQLNGEQIALVPVSPLLRAQEQEEVMRLDRFAELIGARFGPQIAAVVVDIIPYAKRMGEKLGIPKDVLRDEAKMKQAIDTLMPILQNMTGAGVGGPASPVPVGLVGRG